MSRHNRRLYGFGGQSLSLSRVKVNPRGLARHLIVTNKVHLKGTPVEHMQEFPQITQIRELCPFAVVNSHVAFMHAPEPAGAPRP
ncbi:MAG: hypothetical protein WBN02_13175 [Sedimenticolaceae bacterium]|jgi:hypothetical protein